MSRNLTEARPLKKLGITFCLLLFFSAFSVSKTGFEFFNSAGRINYFLVPSIKRVTGTANFYCDIFNSRANFKLGATGAFCFRIGKILRMNVFFHRNIYSIKYQKKQTQQPKQTQPSQKKLSPVYLALGAPSKLIVKKIYVFLKFFGAFSDFITITVCGTHMA